MRRRSWTHRDVRTGAPAGAPGRITHSFACTRRCEGGNGNGSERCRLCGRLLSRGWVRRRAVIWSRRWATTERTPTRCCSTRRCSCSRT
eukprot:2772541-Prymnesium_polylepis.1